MYDRIAKLESDVGHIHTNMSDMRNDIRDIRNYGLPVAGLLIAIFLLFFNALGNRISETKEDVKSQIYQLNLQSNQNENRLIQLQESQTGLIARFDQFLNTGQSPKSYDEPQGSKEEE